MRPNIFILVRCYLCIRRGLCTFGLLFSHRQPKISPSLSGASFASLIKMLFCGNGDGALLSISDPSKKQSAENIRILVSFRKMLSVVGRQSVTAPPQVHPVWKWVPLTFDPRALCVCVWKNHEIYFNVKFVTNKMYCYY